MKSIVIGCDNAAINLKKHILFLLQQEGIPTEDVGCYNSDDLTYYPEIAGAVCKRILDSNFQKDGILICGTGIGMAITANKFKGIRAAVCHDCFSAERARLSNDTNILCLGERVIGIELAKKIVKEWLSLIYLDGPSTPKLDAITHIEQANFNSNGAS